jgi:hypothetical protein
MFLSNLLNELFNTLLEATGYLSEIAIRPFNFQSPLASGNAAVWVLRPLRQAVGAC